MIFPDAKKSATMILSKMSKGGDPSPMQEVKSESEIDPSMDGLKSAAEDVLQAIDSKSGHDLMMALKAFFDMAKDDSEEGME